MDPAAPRRERLARLLPAEGLDALIISNPVNVTYLTGFTGDSSVLVVSGVGFLLVSDPRYTGQIADECPGLDTHIRRPVQELPAAVAEVLTKLGVRSVGFESAAVTVAEHETLRELTPALCWRGAADRVETLRMVKDDAELAEIRQAIAFAERAFDAFRSLLRPHDREKDLCDALDAYVRRAGATGSSFPPIVAAGPRAALPHAPPTDGRVDIGDVLLVDWGASGTRYKSDLTRVLDTRKTSPFARTGPQLEVVHAVVMRARERALATVRPGVEARVVDEAARAAIAGAGFGDYFGHGLGHGIGLQVHEAPAVRPESRTRLEAGMVLTVEPGVYLPGWGGVRIEDDVLVTPDGCEVLTHVPRELGAMRAFA